MKEKPLVENAISPDTKLRNKHLLSFSIKLIPLPELVQRRSILL